MSHCWALRSATLKKTDEPDAHETLFQGVVTFSTMGVCLPVAKSTRHSVWSCQSSHPVPSAVKADHFRRNIGTLIGLDFNSRPFSRSHQRIRPSPPAVMAVPSGRTRKSVTWLTCP